MDAPTNILLLETISFEADAILRGKGTVFMAKAPDAGGVIATKEPIHAIITRGKGDVSAALIDQCPELRVIARCGVGLDNVDVAHATRRGVRVINAPGSNADTVAEHTLGLMLSLQRQTFASVSAVKAGDWAFRNSYDGDEIRGKTLGILGYGNIGRKVELLARAFGMIVLHLAHPQVQAKDDGAMARNLDALLAESDILTIHLPLNATTRQLLDATALYQTKPGALIINTARGEIIDENSLLVGLQSGRIGGYASDVLTTEPPSKDSGLVAHPNVLITPHSASLTARTYNQMCVLTVNNALDLLAGRKVDRRYVFNGGSLG
ncbi:hydroxyacid dehydrogenase [Neolewinella persica]|uniref:hydroxyacid dehydrogenase n=1 Tax=Neolewinella persica TaxID=70998 RepID=UPI00036B1451|nr:hydroxyacid dehydrogenase [Neolewinella persica]